MTQQVSPSSRVGGELAPWHYKSTWDAAQKMFRNEGIWTFYSGLSPALLGLTHVAIQFPLYEFLRLKFTGLEMGQSSQKDGYGNTSKNWIGTSGASFISKICATCATYPHEILRTRLQTQQRMHPPDTPYQAESHGRLVRPPGGSSSDGMRNVLRYRGLVRTFNTILQEEGWRAFYNGMGTNLVRTVPAAMTTMIVFEASKTAFSRLQDQGQVIA